MDGRTFKDYELNNQILKALKGLGYEKPTEVQRRVIPLALDKHDLIVRSQTGSGKTAAYGIPVCEMIDWLENKPQVLILTPTRELAVQVKEDITNIGRLKRIKAIALFGKQPFSIQKNELKQKNHVVVGTPGRIFDHIERGTLSLTQIKCLVIDEADEMLNMGFIDQVTSIIRQLREDRMTILCSATFPEAIKDLSAKFMKNAIDIEMKASGIMADRIEHFQYRVEEEEKLSLLVKVTITYNPDSCIVFCQTKDRVDEVFHKLRKLNYPCNKIHGGMEQEDRLGVMKDFKRGKFRYLVATDVAARGIDIDNISLIINYDIPIRKENYIHRTGRTGRAGLEGKAITFVTSKQEYYMKNIMEYISYDIPLQKAPTDEEIVNCRSAFEAKRLDEPILNKPKNEQLNKTIMTLYINGGKKKKLRATNFVGVISNLEGVTAEDIGIIRIYDTHTYIDILNNKGPRVLKALKNITICGRKLKVSEDKKGQL